MSARHRRNQAEEPAAADPSAPGGRAAADDGGATAGTSTAGRGTAGTGAAPTDAAMPAEEGAAASRRSGPGASTPFEIDSWEPSLLHKLLGIDNTLTKN